MNPWNHSSNSGKKRRHTEKRAYVCLNVMTLNCSGSEWSREKQRVKEAGRIRSRECGHGWLLSRNLISSFSLLRFYGTNSVWTSGPYKIQLSFVNFNWGHISKINIFRFLFFFGVDTKSPKLSRFATFTLNYEVEYLYHPWFSIFILSPPGERSCCVKFAPYTCQFKPRGMTRCLFYSF